MRVHTLLVLIAIVLLTAPAALAAESSSKEATEQIHARQSLTITWVSAGGRESGPDSRTVCKVELPRRTAMTGEVMAMAREGYQGRLTWCHADIVRGTNVIKALGGAEQAADQIRPLLTRTDVPAEVLAGLADLRCVEAFIGDEVSDGIRLFEFRTHVIRDGRVAESGPLKPALLLGGKWRAVSLLGPGRDSYVIQLLGEEE